MLYQLASFPLVGNAYRSRKFSDYSLGKFNFAQNLATLLNLRKTSRFLSLINLGRLYAHLKVAGFTGLKFKAPFKCQIPDIRILRLLYSANQPHIRPARYKTCFTVLFKPFAMLFI